MEKKKENIYRMALKARGYSDDMIDYYYEYLATQKGKGNAIKNLDWIMGFAEFIRRKLK